MCYDEKHKKIEILRLHVIKEVILKLKEYMALTSR